jgi:hypothetical protein
VLNYLAPTQRLLAHLLMAPVVLGLGSALLHRFGFGDATARLPVPTPNDETHDGEAGHTGDDP